jgi:hypothetical protein
MSDEQLLAYIAARHPGWDVHRIFGGWEAVPRKTRVIRGVYLDSIAERLDELLGEGDSSEAHTAQDH